MVSLAPVPKGLKDLARGFNPWSRLKKPRPEVGGRTGAIGVRMLTERTVDQKSSDPSGRGVGWTCYQGLKPLAESFGPFGTAAYSFSFNINPA